MIAVSTQQQLSKYMWTGICVDTMAKALNDDDGHAESNAL